jgi:MFS family permease
MFQCQVSADNSLDNLQGSNSIFRSVWLDKKRVSIGLRQLHLASMPRCIKNAHSALALEPDLLAACTLVVHLEGQSEPMHGDEVDTSLMLYLAAAIFGFSYGGVTSLFPALVGDFYGRLATGAIVGFIFGIAGSSAAFGPLIAGYLYDATKSYNLAFILSGALNIGALLLLLMLKKPQRATSSHSLS